MILSHRSGSRIHHVDKSQRKTLALCDSKKKNVAPNIIYLS